MNEPDDLKRRGIGTPELPVPTEEILKQVEKVTPEIKKVSEPQRAKIVETIASFSGPLPPPSVLAEYELIQPGLVDRIVRMAEQEQLSQRETTNALIGLEKQSLSNEHQYRMRGVNAASLFVILALLVSAGLVVLGHPEAAALMALFGIGNVVTILVSGRALPKSEPADTPRAPEPRNSKKSTRR